MDFEIEGDDDYDFEDDWKRSKSKTSYFGGGDGDGGGDDTYDFDFGDVSSSKNKNSYNNVRSSYAPTASSQPASKLKDVSSVSKSMSAIDKSGDDALAKAQSMLNKYAAKPMQKKKPASSMFDFDEDDISVDSEGASPVRSKGFGQAKSKPTGNQRSARINVADSMDSMDMDSELEDSGSADIGGGLDSGPPMFGEEAPPMPALRDKGRALSFSKPDPIAEKESLASIHNDYDDVVPDEPMPYKGPSGSNYGRTAVNNFSIDEEDVVGDSYSEEEFDEVVEEEEPESRGMSRSQATGGLIGSQANRRSNSDDDHFDNSDFSEKYEESAEELDESKAISEEQNYSMDYAEDVADDDEEEEEVVKPKVNLMSFADLNSIMADDVAVAVPDDAFAAPKSSLSPPKVTKQVEAVVEKENKAAPKQNVPVTMKEPIASTSKPPVVAAVSAVVGKPTPPAVDPEPHAVLGGAYHKVPDFHVSPGRHAEKASLETMDKMVTAPVLFNEPQSLTPSLERKDLEHAASTAMQRNASVAPANSVTFSDVPQQQPQQQQGPDPQQYQQQHSMPGYNQSCPGPAYSQGGQAAYPPAPPGGQGFNGSQAHGEYAPQQPYGPGPFQQYPRPQGGAGYSAYPLQQPYYPPPAPPNLYWSDPRCSYGAMPPMPPGYPYGGGYPGMYQQQEYNNAYGSHVPLPAFGARDHGHIRQSLGSMYSQGLMSSSERPSGTREVVDSSVLEILKELKQAKEEAAEANRRLADVLLSINSGNLMSSFRASSTGEKTSQSKESGPNSKKDMKKAPEPEPLDSSAEELDEYSNDFEDSQDVRDAKANKESSKINFDKSSHPTAPAVNRYSNVRMSSASDAANPGSDTAMKGASPEIGSDAGRSDHPNSIGKNMWDVQMDPMTSTLMTSQMLFRKQLMNLRERIQYTNLLHDFDKTTYAHLQHGGK